MDLSESPGAQGGASPRPKRTVAPLLVLPALTALDITAMNVVLPSVGGNFGAGASESVWILTSYLVAMSVGTLLVGPVGYTLLAIIVLAISLVGLRIGVRLFDREAILTRWR